VSDQVANPLALLALFLIGLAIGSFLNVVIYRIPRGESLTSPPSHCPNCDHAIRFRHNVPVVSWILLRGRCADCGATIGVRYPLIELGTGLAFVGLAVQLSRIGLRAAIPAYLYFAAMGLALAVIDVQWRRLPNAIVLPSYPIVAALLLLAAAIQGDWWRLARAGTAAAILLSFFFLLAVVSPAGMGLGDVKLAGIVGGVLGYVSWSAVVVGAFGGFVLGAVVGVAVILAQRGNRKTAIPFGPFMIAGALLALPAAGPIADLYFKLPFG